MAAFWTIPGSARIVATSVERLLQDSRSREMVLSSVAFVFDTLGLGAEPLLGRDEPQSLADVMHCYSASAAIVCAPQADMHFDTASEVVDSLAAKLALWKGVR